MKLTVTILLLVAASQAIELKSTPTRQKKSDNAEKAEFAEGNSGIEKRAPVLATVSPSATPGIEYADSKETHQDKSPAQQIYATPLPQIAKISDVLTGQGPPFQAAIASHLYAPVSVYQTRLGAPTTYEVSRPIASQLAYSEHKISYQPPQNAIQYSQPIQYNQKLQTPKQANFARPINFQQPYQQQILIQPQATLYAHQPQLVSQPIYRQIPQFPIQIQRPVQYIQNAEPSQQYIQQPIYSQGQNLLQVVNAQPGITYAHEEPTLNQEQPAQRESKLEAQQQSTEKLQISQQEKNHNSQSQGAVSYASFSQSQPAPNFVQQRHQQPVQYQPQPQYQVQQLQRIQLQQPPQYQPLLIQAPQVQYQSQQQNQPQIQYQNQQVQVESPQREHSKSIQESISTASTKSLPVSSGRQISYFRPGAIYSQIQPQLLQAQAYQQSPKFLIQSPQPVPLAGPSFPPVQYFGKYAQSIFGGYHQQ